MRSLEQKSKKLDKINLFLFGLLAVLVAALVAPSVGVAAPDGPEPPEPQPQLSFEPDHYDFGLQPLNWGSQQTTFQLRNTGSEALQVGSPQISGSGSSAFWTGSSNCYGAFLQPGEACYAQIYFGPYEIANYAAQFSVNVGDDWFSADLSGTGGRAILAPTASSTDFGVAKVGSAGTTREIEIANKGNMPGSAFIAVIAGGAIGSFELLDENCTGIEIMPTATCTLQVRFRPVSEGVKKAILGLFGENDGPAPIILTGVGTAADPVSAESPVVAAVTASANPRSKYGKRRQKAQRRSKRHRLAVQSARLVLRARPGG